MDAPSRRLLGHLQTGGLRPQPTASHEFYFATNTQTFSNWADVIQFANSRHQKVRVVGAAHSPSDIAMTKDHLINLDYFNKVLHIDKEQLTVRAQAGIRLFELNELLAAQGLGLRILGSIAEQSLAGAISTATHGSGLQFGTLSDEIVYAQFVTAAGEIVECSVTKNPDYFDAIRCSLGALGVITELTIKVEPLQNLEYFQYPMRYEKAMRDLKKLAESAEHTRIWWFPHTDWCVVWQANRVEPKRKLTFTKLKDRALQLRDKLIGYYSLELMLYVATYAPGMIPAINKAYMKLLHGRGRKGEDVSYKAFVFDCLFKQYVNEWSLPIELSVEGINRLKELIERKNIKAHFPIEIRFVKGDNVWLSPAQGGDKCYIGIIMYRPYGKDVVHKEYFEEFERIMTELGGRPHWAKNHGWTATECSHAYPMFKRFMEVRQALDPEKLFWNDYLDRVIGL